MEVLGIIIGFTLVGLIWLGPALFLRSRSKREIEELRERIAMLEAVMNSAPPDIPTIAAASSESPALPLRPEPPLPPVPPPAPQPPPIPWTPSPPPIPMAPQEPSPGWRDRFQGEEWEALIGGSLLNKLGALILVIGIALLLRLSLDTLGAAGRIAVGAGTGLALLAGGHWIERKERYRIFAIGFLAAGWATIYFTAFAAHGIKEARIIESPVAGLAVLVTTAAAMIAATLRYRSQWITGLGFAAAFAALELDPGSGFALIASVVLAMMLLGLSWRHGWLYLPLGAILAVYAVAALHPQAPMLLEGIGHPILWIYWLLFEAYDLARARRGTTRGALARIQFLLNGMAFVSVSLLAARNAPPDHYSAFLGLAAMAFAVSFALRLGWQGGFSDELLDSALSVPGIALTTATLLAMFAVGLRFDGLKQTLGFLMVSQVVFLFAWQQNRRFPHVLAMAVNGFTAAKLCLLDPPSNGRIVAMGREMDAVSPMLLLAAAVFAFDRAVVLRWLYSVLGVGCAALLVWLEVPPPFHLAGWAALASGLWWKRGSAEFRYEAWALATVISGFASGWVVGAGGPHHAIAWIAAGAALAWQCWTMFREQLPERRLVLLPLTAATLLCTAALAWQELPSPLVGPAWGLLALAAIEMATSAGFKELEWCGIATAHAAAGRLLYANFPARGHTGVLSHRLLTAAPFIPLFYWAWTRTRHRLFLWIPPLLAFLLVRFEIGRVNSAVGMIAICLALLWAGQKWSIADLRWQSYLVALAAFARAFSTNMRVLGEVAGVPLRILAGAIVVTGLLAAHRLARRDAPAAIDRYARPAFAVLAAILAAALLQFEVEGRSLTVAWSIEGVLLLMAGFLWSERVLRVSGLVLFLFCVLKLFFFDLASLEGMARIVSFIVLGVLLMAASWLYTRFRDQLKRLL